MDFLLHRQKTEATYLYLMLNTENIIIIIFSLNNHSNLNPYNVSSREIISVLLDNDLRSLILSPLRRMMFYSKSSHTAHSHVIFIN